MPRTAKMVDCPECGKRINAQGLGGHLYIVHGKRAGSKECEDRVSGLEEKLVDLSRQYEERLADLDRREQCADVFGKQFTEYNDRINRLLDDLLDVVKSLYEAADKAGAVIEKHGSRLDVLEREYKTGLQDLRDKLLDLVGQSHPTG